VQKLSDQLVQPSAERLLRSIAEELKAPLLRIARQAELARIDQKSLDLGSIEASADGALKLLDSYLISTQLCNGQTALDLEPVSVSATMYDVAQYLNKLAKIHSCSIDLQVSSGSGLIMAHPLGLRAAFMGLGYSFINAMDQQSDKQKIIFVAKKSPEGVRAGIYSSQIKLGSEVYKKAKKLYGSARQPLPEFSYLNGAGLYVADMLFEAMSSSLKVMHYRKSSGLAGVFLPSQQMSIL
jgi:K+-sensing histidine kinase KdpD